MKNKKGEGAISAIIVLAIMVIVGSVIYSEGIIPSVNGPTQLYTSGNTTVTAASAGSFITIPGQRNVTTVLITNATNNTLTPAQVGSNFTVSTQVVDGVLKLTLNTKSGTQVYAGRAVNVSYQYQPEGYLEDAPTRSIFLLTILFSALGILLVAVATASERVRSIVGLD